ncbi:protein toll-like [Choristoneura fumiferana]|uniref:protein toll-like n=1 Tax=Choristoneura fumiferana TaxID=7141 RepID=UPI003D1570FE
MAGRALALVLALALVAAAMERPHCRVATCVEVVLTNKDHKNFFTVNGRTLNIIYDESTSVFSVRCNEGDPGEPGPVLAADERALPALPALTDVAFAEFQGCRAPAGSYADALRALNVNVVAKLWLQYLPAESRLTRAQLAGLGALRELKLSGSTPESPLRPTPDFLAELPQLKILRLYLVEAPHALPTLPATLELLELKETALPAAERALGGAAAGLHWLLRLHALRRLTLFDQYTDDRLAPPPLAALHMLEEASLRVPLAPLPARWLAGSGLRKLSLSSCGLSDLNSFPFEGATNLRTLYVSENNLTVLPIRVFGSLPALEFLDVSNNELTDAALVRALYGAPVLTDLLASFNPLGSLCGSSSIAHGRVSSELPLTLRRLELRRTRATRLCSDWLRDARNLTLIDLRDNLIKTLDYSELVMTRNSQLAGAGVRLLLDGNTLPTLQVAPHQLAACRDHAREDTRARVELSLSELECTCDNSRLRALLRDCNKLLALAADAPCSSGGHGSFLQRDPDQLLCDYLDCPEGCSCGTRLRDNATVAQCAGAGARWPGWAAASAARPLALLAPAAGLTTVPPYRLVELIVPNNSIAALDLDDIPDTLRELDLRDNRIARVSEAAAARLRDVRVRLAGNPFACDCRDQLALARLRDANVSDWDELRCGSGALRGLALSELRPGDLCGGALSWQLGAAAAAAALALLAGAGVALWPRVRPRIKQLLFERQLCLEWVLGASDEVADPGKTHDAFVSYAHQDHALAARVVRGLEARGYSTLEHCRDWHPGAAVSEHIARSVECARRTLLLVSDHYGESKWALEEFRIAHAHALERRSARVLLLRGGLRAPERLPRDLQLHLCLHTYLDLHDLDDPVFWRKLCQAMPPLGGGKPPVGGGKPPAPAPLGGGKLPRLTAPPEAHEAAERLGRLLSPPPPAREAPPDRSVDTLNGTAER